MKVALDAMGGDHAPDEVVRGGIEAALDLGIEVALVGEEAAINSLIRDKTVPPGLTVHHCTESIRMDETPLKAVRMKKDASIRVAFELVKIGQADAVVSAGNSGAMLAAGVLTLGRLPGVDRPAIAGLFPGEKGTVILIDVGANVDCRPLHLLQFAVMAHAFAVSCMGIASPKVGLLSIGEEKGKGNEQVRQAHELLQQSPLNFVGNIEGRDLLKGEVQVVVCDGFVGNVALKLMEGMGEMMAGMLVGELSRSLAGKASLLLGRGGLKRLKTRLDYQEYGGAPLLGVNGVGMVCHGGSSARAIKNAIGLAARYVENRVLGKMAAQLAAVKAVGGTAAG
jgi:glycerol-3-phosphate acyltransferase PlsX